MIELQDVSFRYPHQEQGMLENIDLTIAKGECVLLCGPSGCGKTTITRLINGLIPHFYGGYFKGEVMIDGRKVSSVPMYQLANQVGSVFQNPRTQFFNVDTDSEIAFGIENAAYPPQDIIQRVDETVDALEIEALRGRNIFQLSGGEKQMIAFASIYAMHPDIYLLDEPSSNLDQEAISKLKRHLALVKAQGKTIMIAEHRLHYLMELVDRIIYLEDGQIKGRYLPEDFRALAKEKRQTMGLRAISLGEEMPNTASSTQQSPELTLSGVTLYHKKQPILADINVTAHSGEVIAITGRNGTGKTTLSRFLCGLHKESQGEVCWNGKALKDKQRLSRAYMVLQDVNYQLFAESVAAECSFGVKVATTEEVTRTMNELQLLSLKDQHPNTLSGGQKQRVAVAVSRICQKELLIFDEPTSGLDYHSMTQVASLISELAAEGKIIFIVTHDYEFLMKTCCRLIHLAKGCIDKDIQITADTVPQVSALFHM